MLAFSDHLNSLGIIGNINDLHCYFEFEVMNILLFCVGGCVYSCFKVYVLKTKIHITISLKLGLSKAFLCYEEWCIQKNNPFLQSHCFVTEVIK